MKRGTVLAAVVVGLLTFTGSAVGAAPDGLGPWADYVVSYNPAMTINPVGPVPLGRNDPTQALGVAESFPGGGDDNPIPVGTFVSLGFGGSLTLGFDNPICNQPGVDLAIDVREITLEPYPDERAQVYVSENGVTFLLAGTVTKDGSVAMPVGITVANFVRLVDVSNPADFVARPNQPDGFDVDGVRALNSSCPPGKIEICKAATNAMANKPFQFTLNGGTAFTVKGGRCTGPITTQPGLNVVRELATTPPTDVAGVSVRPSNRLISQDLENRTVRVRVVSGSTAASETKVTFTNEPGGGATGDLKICKVSRTPAFWGRQFSFRVNGGPLVSTEAGPEFDPSLWSCRIVGSFQTGSVVTVQEQVPPGTVVDYIDTDPIERLVDFNLLTGTAEVEIGGGTNIVTFDNEAVAPDQTGYIEVCKDAAWTGPGFTPDPAVTGLFTFTVDPFDGDPFDVSTYPGQCTAALPVPAGVVRVTEHARPNITLVDVLTDPDTALLDSNLINRTADVEVPVSADPSFESQVHFVNAANRAQLKVCKTLGPGSADLIGQTFRFDVVGVGVFGVTALAATQCTPVGTFPVGSSVTVNEVFASVDDQNTKFDETGAFIDSSGGGTVTIGAGTNQVTITNTARGLLEICKNPVPGIATQPTFRYRIDGGGYLSIPAGSCLPARRVSVGVHTVQEILPADYELDPSGAGNGILVGPNPPSREVDRPATATVRVQVPYGPDETKITFTNRIQRGSVKVCKAAGSTPNTTFNYTIYVEGPPGAFTALPASASPSVCSLPTAEYPILQSNGAKTIIGVQEQPGAFDVTAIGVTGSRGPCTPSNGPPAACPFATGQDLAMRIIDFFLGPGTNEVTYTNRSG